MDGDIDRISKKQLMDEIPALRAEIQALYRRLDRRFDLHGADVPMEFGFDGERLGAYTPALYGQKEQFYFSLLFIGYLHENALSKEDKLDLYKHEYAHYMQYHMDIPREYRFKGGIHGSAWMYCCSLVGAAPSAYYRFGAGREQHDYQNKLKDPWKNPHVTLLDTAHRKKEYENSRNRIPKYSRGDSVTHPKFGEGVVEEIEQMEGSVRLTIRFSDAVRKIDQKWLIRSQYQSGNGRR
ncbi:MAG: hypothetical protein ACI4ET_06190 [Bilifractor sp.]